MSVTAASYQNHSTKGIDKRFGQESGQICKNPVDNLAFITSAYLGSFENLLKLAKKNCDLPENFDHISRQKYFENCSIYLKKLVYRYWELLHGDLREFEKKFGRLAGENYTEYSAEASEIVFGFRDLERSLFGGRVPPARDQHVGKLLQKLDTQANSRREAVIENKRKRTGLSKEKKDKSQRETRISEPESRKQESRGQEIKEQENREQTKASFKNTQAFERAEIGGLRNQSYSTPQKEATKETNLGSVEKVSMPRSRQHETPVTILSKHNPRSSVDKAYRWVRNTGSGYKAIKEKERQRDAKYAGSYQKSNYEDNDSEEEYGKSGHYHESSRDKVAGFNNSARSAKTDGSEYLNSMKSTAPQTLFFGPVEKQVLPNPGESDASFDSITSLNTHSNHKQPYSLYFLPIDIKNKVRNICHDNMGRTIIALDNGAIYLLKGGSIEESWQSKNSKTRHTQNKKKSSSTAKDPSPTSQDPPFQLTKLFDNRSPLHSLICDKFNNLIFFDSLYKLKYLKIGSFSVPSENKLFIIEENGEFVSGHYRYLVAGKYGEKISFRRNSHTLVEYRVVDMMEQNKSQPLSKIRELFDDSLFIDDFGYCYNKPERNYGEKIGASISQQLVLISSSGILKRFDLDPKSQNLNQPKASETGSKGQKMAEKQSKSAKIRKFEISSEGKNFRLGFDQMMGQAVVSFERGEEEGLGNELVCYIISLPPSGDVSFVNKLSFDTGVGKIC